ncbi:cation:proton antiporter [Patescibacteria group bacterium]|nr:cation:proton antiporter [Patescibacteria group bacterium]MBU1890408.1 cation:proton antiporter [Patescibacteria group bacterium]
MGNIFLFIAGAYILTLVVGQLFEKIKVPWIFAALLIGSLLAINNPFRATTESDVFIFMAQLGMYLLLFTIGLEINLKSIKKKKGFILKSAFFIIFFEAIFGSLLVHFVFGYNWLVSFLVALSFATVGEAILIPILEKSKIINTRLGQAIIGIGTLDDIIEVFTLVMVIILVGSSIHGHVNISLVILALLLIFMLTIGFSKFKKVGKRLALIKEETLFLFAIFVLFLFLGIGVYAEASALAALLAGVALKNIIPEKKLQTVKKEIKIICYGFFAPIFFLWVGTTLNINYLIKYPLLILLIVSVSCTAKLIGGYIMGRKTLGTKKSLLLGLGLSVRFSTSIIIIKILFDSNLINDDLYSIVVASSIIFTIIIPIAFARLLNKWNTHSISDKS